MTKEEAFLDAILKNRDDHGYLQAYADWLEGRGSGKEMLASALRWMVYFNRFPYEREAVKYRWIWVRSGRPLRDTTKIKKYQKIAPRAVLPSLLWSIRFRHRWVVSLKSFHEAVHALAVSIKPLSDVLGVKP